MPDPDHREGARIVAELENFRGRLAVFDAGAAAVPTQAVAGLLADAVARHRDRLREGAIKQRYHRNLAAPYAS